MGKFLIPDISDYLKSGLKKAIDSYQTIQQEDIPIDAKGFASYHNACKSALMHIGLLLKLLQGVEINDSETETDWLKLARKTLNSEAEAEDEMFFS